MKKRLDLLLFQKKLVNSRTNAQQLIRSGNVLVDDKVVIKSGYLCDLENKISFKKLDYQWVSRGALKLLHAIEYFDICIDKFICLDIGASTGGFTEVLLSKKAKKIYAVDVGTNQLNEKFLYDNRVIDISQTNAKNLDNTVIIEEIDMIVCDVSFISMKKVIQPSINFLNKNKGIIISLIKPQFEVEKKELKKGGIINDSIIHERICNDYRSWFYSELKMKVIGIIPSPIDGLKKGNKEFLIYAKR